ncbi:hypothetical protein PPACK8108_LOCUS5425 [Phakopsora pachyrhizi]|uniref:Uncharacterized protein n=1 Tax=Phakopsora pachyrhizi TaxID=170000 RepID=A0AAV0ASH6_PHAPC|nr:hypothetical protein PPACK8108_LOCUS5425 [Phakopsora pachyrhizi]
MKKQGTLIVLLDHIYSESNEEDQDSLLLWQKGLLFQDNPYGSLYLLPTPGVLSQMVVLWPIRPGKNQDISAAEEAQGRKKEPSRLLYEAEQDNNKHSNLKKSSNQPIPDEVKDLIMDNFNTGSVSQKEVARKFKDDSHFAYVDETGKAFTSGSDYNRSLSGLKEELKELTQPPKD